MLYASQHQIAPQGRKPMTLSITASGRNINLRTLADAAGYNGTSPAAVTVTVAAGVIIGSTSTSTYALDTGTWPTGTTLRLIIGSGAYVVGRGGDGGYPPFTTPALSGGPALRLRVATTIINLGTIGGGGGGGGLTIDDGTSLPGDEIVGGRSTFPFSGGGAGDLPGNYGYGGINPLGTLTTGGKGSVDIYSVYQKTGGNGGDLGMPGTVGDMPGGSAGAAITGGAYATYATTGTILGSILS
ncbi:hypothetical protein [Insolitispirillum peregrinum]|uniref:Phage tail fibre adhesin Gp38 n=1 Tax=Insolitispirillum peregrinum TaxID=80876 RepID=A0A1N7JKE4_9PROT|nr:hypothetical protein [Insolitispirillum peregrinum]SIS49805.1 Phage tail fibre adhesin Gp38 [Insolitispirillum peregrinum]